MGALAVVDLELAMSPRGDGYVAEATLTQPGSQAEATLAADAPLGLDPAALLLYTADASAYGAALTGQLFPEGGPLRRAWERARAVADGAGLPLRLRLRLPATATELSALRWETLRDPLSGAPLASDERVRLVRYLGSADTRPLAPGPRPELQALLVVASPDDLGAYGMDEIDAEGEAGRVRKALGDIPLAIIGPHDDAAARATMAALQEALRATPAILCMICHGRHGDDDTLLWLEDEAGNAAPVPGSALAELVAQLARPPLLALLIACEGGGASHHAGALAALGPRLALAGVGAVVAMQQRVSMSAARAFLPALVKALAGDGSIDRAVSVARAALRSGDEWWVPALWLRLRDGALWQDGAEAAQPAGGGPTFNISGPISAGVVNVGGTANFHQPLHVSLGGPAGDAGARPPPAAPPGSAAQPPGGRQAGLAGLLAELEAALGAAPAGDRAAAERALRIARDLVAEASHRQANADLVAYYRRGLREAVAALADAVPAAPLVIVRLERQLDFAQG